MAHTITAAQLDPNVNIRVRGVVRFARLNRYATAEELARANAMRQFPKQGNYLTITIGNAEIVPKNPGGLTKEEIYVQESFYQSKKHGDLEYRIEYKSKMQPRYFQPAANGQGWDEVDVPGQFNNKELASGLNVELDLHTFATNYANKGLSLDAVWCLEPIRFFSGGNNAFINDLLAQGTVINELPTDTRQPLVDPIANGSAQPAMPVAPAPDAPAAPMAGTNPYAAVEQMQTPVQPAPMVQPTPVQTVPNVFQAGTPGVTYATAPAAPTAPTAPAQPGVAPISFDPNDMNRNY